MTLNFAGAGADALSWLHSVGGSSRSILEATDRYSPASLIEATGFTPNRYTSVEVADALATHAFTRAHHLAKPGAALFGVACTATIATDRKKKGEHRCYVSVRDNLGMRSYGLTLHKGARNRQDEEQLVSSLIVRAVAEACGLYALPDLALLAAETLEEQFRPHYALAELLAGERDWLLIGSDGQIDISSQPRNIAILSGSFHPLHEGHRRLAAVAAEFLGRDVYFELSISNAEKANVKASDLRHRALQFTGSTPVILSRAALFSDKANLFPGSSFILGADTAARLVSARFYDENEHKMLEALHKLRDNGSSFLVAGRGSAQDGFRTLQDVDIPADFADMFTELPESIFRMNISSTEIRQQHQQNTSAV